MNQTEKQDQELTWTWTMTKKRQSPYLFKWALLGSIELAEMVLGRGLGAESPPHYSGRFAWSPLGVGCHCMSEPVSSASLPAPLSPTFSS